MQRERDDNDIVAKSYSIDLLARWSPRCTAWRDLEYRRTVISLCLLLVCESNKARRIMASHGEL